MCVEKKTILLVEDDSIIALAEQKEIEQKGYIVKHVNTGEDAVEIALEDNSQIDLILMDINLGKGMDGTEAAREILSQREIPILFLSSHTEPEIVEKTEKITSYGYVVKNTGITVLDASIKMALKLFNAQMKQKETELKLRESEKRYSTLADASYEGILIHDHGITIDANSRFQEMFGYTLDELKQMSAFELITPEYQSILKAKIAKGELGPYTVVALRKDGSTFIEEIQAREMEYQGKNVRVVACRDITYKVKGDKTRN